MAWPLQKGPTPPTRGASLLQEMTMNLKTLLASSSLLALSLAACGGSSSSDGVAKGADKEHVTRAFAAAAFDGQLATILAVTYTLGDDSVACPKISNSGSTVTVQGGCTMDDGSAVKGSITINGLVQFGDATKPLTIEYDHFSLGEGKQGLAIDGSITASKDDFSFDGTVSLIGIASTDHIGYTQDANHSLTFSDDSFIDVDGMGQFDASGTFNFGDSENNVKASGKITLAGQDTLSIDLSKANEQGCFAYEIDGQSSGNVCTESDAGN
jgi:hypothetical protein